MCLLGINPEGFFVDFGFVCFVFCGLLLGFFFKVSYEHCLAAATTRVTEMS